MTTSTTTGARHRLLVFSNPVAGRDDDYNHWYDTVHITEVLEVDGFVGCQRFAVDPGTPGAPARYLAIYEIDADDPVAAFTTLQSAVGDMTVSDAIDRTSVAAWIVTAHGERVALP
jgi:hypothetical protein